MGSRVHRLEAWGLITGPVLALTFFLLEPGALVFDRAEYGDAEATIRALASNAAIAHTVALMVPLGLILMLYGFSGISRAIGGDSMAAALSRLGILCMTVGVFGWILASGLAHVLAGTDLDSARDVDRAIAVYHVDTGVAILSSMAVASGFLVFNLGLWALLPSGRRKMAALAVAAISLVCLVALIIGHNVPEPDMITLARLCYFPWVAWTVILGAGFLRGRELTGETEAGAQGPRL